MTHQGPSHDASLHSRQALFRRVLLSLLLLCASYSRTTTASNNSNSSSSALMNLSHEEGNNCSEPAVEDFPGDFLTHDQRSSGGVVIHIVIVIYLVLSLGVICDEYFVPALQLICDILHLRRDVAGATFMAAGTSSPELFANIIGTFITQSDLGIGTIIGSAVFNIFGVISLCGLFTLKKLPLDWYSISRDCFFYSIAIIVLFIVLNDEKVFWYESLIMLICYCTYIVMMFFNNNIEAWVLKTKKRIHNQIYPRSFVNNEMVFTPSATFSKTISTISYDTKDLKDVAPEPMEETHEYAYPWERPKNEGFIGTAIWFLMFPVRILLFLTVPNVLMGPTCRKLVPLTFILCIVWIGGICYMLTWMITIIGYTLFIPDSVMGLTFLAIGTSFPEVFSSFLVSRQGYGSMAVSTSIGSNTFDILFCLGMPWFIKALIHGTSESHIWYVKVNSEGLANTVVSLLVCLVVLYIVLIISKFTLSRMLGVICLIIYLIFVTFSILVELNVFYDVNKPMCRSIF